MDDFRIYNRCLIPEEINDMSTLANSDTLVDTNALKVRFNFNAPNAPIVSKLLVPSYGILQSSPRLGPGAIWTATTNALSPQTFAPNPAMPSLFYRTTLNDFP